jgi:hypothetical protein
MGGTMTLLGMFALHSPLERELGPGVSKLFQIQTYPREDVKQMIYNQICCAFHTLDTNFENFSKMVATPL